MIGCGGAGSCAGADAAAETAAEGGGVAAGPAPSDPSDADLWASSGDVDGAPRDEESVRGYRECFLS